MKQWFSSLARIVIFPRSTMRTILERSSGTAAIPLVILALLAGLFGDLDGPAIHRSMAMRPASVWLIVAAVLIGVMAAMVLAFYFFSWVAYRLGRLMEGQGTLRESRQALGWGLAPLVWSLLYRVPFALLVGNMDNPGGQLVLDEKSFVFKPGLLTHGCGVALLVALIDLAIAIWYLFVASSTIAEAHRFSTWKGLGTIVACIVAPVVVAAAATLAAL